MEQIIIELLDWGIIISGVSLTEDNSLAYYIEGFYKSDNVLLYQKSGTFYAKARYDEITDLGNSEGDVLYQLTLLNYEWWNRSKDRYDGWSKPDERWTYLLKEFNLPK